MAGVPAAARAQTGWVVLPSFTLAEEFDDNVFVSTTDPQSDFITRMTPGLQLGYRSEPFRLLTVSLNVTYFETNTPSELVPTTGLQLARIRATQLAIIPAATYQITSV